MPHNRDKSTDKNRNTSSFFEKMFRRFQFFLIQKEIFSEFSDERFSSIISYRIRQQRSDNTSQSTYNNNSSKTEVFCRYKKSCKWHDGFTWYRKDHAFHNHSEEYCDVPSLLDKSRDIGCEKFCDSHGRESSRVKVRMRVNLRKENGFFQ